MVFLFLTFFMFATSSTAYSSELIISERNLIEFNLARAAAMAWKTVEHNPVNIEKHVHTIARISKRLEILWKVKYAHLLSEDFFYALIVNFEFIFPRECFIDGTECVINEAHLSKYLDETIDTIVHACTQPSQAAQSSAAQPSQAAQSSVAQSSVAPQIITVHVPPDIVPEKTNAAIMRTLNSVSNKVKQRYPEFKSDAILSTITIGLAAYISSKEELIPHTQKIGEHFIPLLFAQIKDFIDLCWKNRYNQLMGNDKKSVKEFNEIASHCIDVERCDEALLTFSGESFFSLNVNEGFGIKCMISPRVKTIITRNLDHDIKYLVDIKAKKKQEQQVLLLKQNEDRRRSLRDNAHKKEISNCMIAQDHEYRTISQERNAWFDRISFEQSMLKERASLSAQICHDLDVELTAAALKAEQQKNHALVVAANTVSAKRFYDAQEKTDEKKTVQRNRLTLVRFMQSIQDLIFSCDSGRAVVETEERLEIEKIDIDNQHDWRLAAQKTMKRMQNDRDMFKAQAAQEAIARVQAAKEIEAAHASLVDAKVAQLQVEESIKAVKREAAEAKAAQTQAEERIKAVEAKAAQEVAARVQAERELAEATAPFLAPVRQLPLAPVGYGEDDLTYASVPPYSDYNTLGYQEVGYYDDGYEPFYDTNVPLMLGAAPAAHSSGSYTNYQAAPAAASAPLSPPKGLTQFARAFIEK